MAVVRDYRSPREMDTSLRRMMLEYYNERAPEYEETYTLGTGTASISDPGVFIADITRLVEVVARFGHVSSSTLVDQSENMLRECLEKVRARCLDDRRFSYPVHDAWLRLASDATRRVLQ